MTNLDKKKIKDNPTSAELLQTVEGMKHLSKIVSFLEKLGIKNAKLSKAFEQVPDLVQKTNDLIHLPDRFNDHFSKVGWVAHESMNMELMKEAVKLADADRFAEAEHLLTEHYDEETLHWGLTFMKGLEEYRPREELAQKAKEDYLAGRYHACIPVVLTIIDGIVNDIEQKGFFAQGVDLTAWDSIAAHSSGLQELANLFNESRKKTTTEKITIPYRHGILHGRDLGYANEIVAAKTWAALFAIKDWALAIKQGGKHPKEKEPEPGLMEIRKSYAKVQEEKSKIEAWKPRMLTVGKDCPETGVPEVYEAESPERTLALFMQYWMKNNYGGMAQLIKTFGDIPGSGHAGDVRENFQDKLIKDFRFLNIADKAPAATEITVEVDISYNNRPIKKEIQVRLLHEDEAGNPIIGDEPKGKWLILDHSFNSIISLIGTH